MNKMFFSKKPKIKKIKEELNNNINTVFTLNDIFPDSILANNIATILGITTKHKINLEQLNTIETLNCSNQSISNLEGLEFLNYLKTANFSNNNIKKLPDYTQNNSNLYKNKNTLILMDLSNNPFLDPNNLFSLENTEQRRKFLGQFEDSYSRFKLGNVKERIYTEPQLNPEIIRIAIETFIPRSNLDKNNQINDIFLKYLIGENIFYNKNPYKNDYIINDGKLNFKKDLIKPEYLNSENKRIVSQLIEEIIPNENLYLIRSLINNSNTLPILNSSNIEDYIDYYKKHPDELSNDYIKNSSGWIEKSQYTDLKNSNLSSQEEIILNSIMNSIVKSEFSKYLQIKDILELYRNEHPEKFDEVNKLIIKNDNQIFNFINQYIDLEKNQFLTDKQKEKIKQAEKSLQTFNKNYLKQATDLFEQDVFGLEVEMKYMDMLAEANKNII